MFLSIGGIMYAQTPNFINASTSSSINAITTDNSNNLYMHGFVNGRIYINGQYKDYTKNTRVLGKLDEKNNFKWVVELESNPRDITVINETLYLLIQERVKGDPTESYSLSLVSYDLKGTFLNKKLLTSIKGTSYDVFVDGKFIGNQILTWATLDEKTSTAVLDGKNIINKMYNQYIFSRIDLTGNHIWDYSMEGGTDGFTDLRVHVTHEDTWDLYIVCSFGSQANVGINQYTTDIMFKEKIPLYYNKVFLLKLNKQGKPVKSVILGENALTVEDMKIDANGNIYFAGYFKGNDSFAKKQADARPYIGVKFFGKSFEYTEAESTMEPDEDGFVAKVDSSWNIRWIQLIKGKSTVRATDITLTTNGIALGGYYSYDMKINSKEYTAHSLNAGYGDAFYTTLDQQGNFGIVTTFTGVKSDFITVQKDIKGNLLIWGTCQEKNIEINGNPFTSPSYYNSAYIYR